MKHNKNDVLQFFGGLAMLVVGLYWLFTNVTVTSGFFRGTMYIGGVGILFSYLAAAPWGASRCLAEIHGMKWSGSD